jgi:DNA polymerase III gamma/tau subunit
MSEELYRKYRPTRLKDVVGQPEAVSILSSYLKNDNLPHVILFAGTTGAGKTTIARIIKSKLNCCDTDFTELNCAEHRGIDDMRDIQRKCGLAAINGGSRIWLLDEVGKITTDAQNCLLKTFEDTPRHVYFLLATTDPEKLIPTIRNRCCVIPIKPIQADDMLTILTGILEKEGKTLTDKVLNKIIECSEGSARQAIQSMEKAIQLEDEEAQLSIVEKPSDEQIAFQITQALLWQKKKWPEIAELISQLPEGTEPEGIRQLILKCANKELLKPKGNHARAYLISQVFAETWDRCKFSGLSACCYEVASTR